MSKPDWPPHCSLGYACFKGDSLAFEATAVDPDGPLSSTLVWHLRKLPPSGPPETRVEVGAGATLLLTIPDDGAIQSTRYQHTVLEEIQAYSRQFTVE